MFTKKINHLALYAKNFYRHTNDVVSDMFAVVGKDHPELTITDENQLRQIMESDYKEWVNSLPVRYYIHVIDEFENNEEPCKVSWYEKGDIRNSIFGILISYEIWIPLSVLSEPEYEKDSKVFWPQSEIIGAYSDYDCSDIKEAALKFFRKDFRDSMFECVEKTLECTDKETVRKMYEAAGLPNTFNEELREIIDKFKRDFDNHIFHDNDGKIHYPTRTFNYSSKTLNASIWSAYELNIGCPNSIHVSFRPFSYEIPIKKSDYYSPLKTSSEEVMGIISLIIKHISENTEGGLERIARTMTESRLVDDADTQELTIYDTEKELTDTLKNLINTESNLFSGSDIANAGKGKTRTGGISVEVIDNHCNKYSKQNGDYIIKLEMEMFNPYIFECIEETIYNMNRSISGRKD